MKTARAGQILKIAVTGSAGSGKSAVCERLQQLGLKVVSSDALAKAAVLPGTVAFRRIVDAFGARVVLKDGTLDRPALRRIMVEDSTARKTLEGIVHPEVFRRINALTKAAGEKGEPAIVVEIPLLFEISAQSRFDLVLLVVAEREAQIRRLTSRDRVTRDGAAALLATQMPDSLKLEKADYIIRNHGSMAALIEQVDRFYDRVSKKK